MSDDPRKGRVFIVNNRGTATIDDDLVLDTAGPVFYRDIAQPNVPLEKARPQLWTTAAIQLVDRRHQPESTTITAMGMQVFLQPEAAGTGRENKKAKGQGVDRIGRPPGHFAQQRRHESLDRSRRRVSQPRRQACRPPAPRPQPNRLKAATS